MDQENQCELVNPGSPRKLELKRSLYMLLYTNVPANCMLPCPPAKRRISSVCPWWRWNCLLYRAL